MAQRIALVSCGKQKLEVAAPAKDLYQSVLFKKTRAYVERHYDRWLILSALHRVLDPEDLVQPYDLRMPTKRVQQELWARQAGGYVHVRIPAQSHVDLFCGEDYEGVARHLGAYGHTTGFPLAGLQVGERLHWLTEKLLAGANEKKAAEAALN
jgi:hypothetical protein